MKAQQSPRCNYKIYFSSKLTFLFSWSVAWLPPAKDENSFFVHQGYRETDKKSNETKDHHHHPNECFHLWCCSYVSYRGFISWVSLETFKKKLYVYGDVAFYHSPPIPDIIDYVGGLSVCVWKWSCKGYDSNDGWSCKGVHRQSPPTRQSLMYDAKSEWHGKGFDNTERHAIGGTKTKTNITDTPCGTLQKRFFLLSILSRAGNWR